MECSEIYSNNFQPNFKEILKQNIDQSGYQAWLANCNFEQNNDNLDIIFDNAFTMNFAKKKYEKTIQNIAKNTLFTSNIQFKIQSKKTTQKDQLNHNNVINLEIKNPVKSTQSGFNFIAGKSNAGALATIDYILNNQNSSMLHGKILHISGEKSSGKTALLKYAISKIDKEKYAFFTGFEFASLYSNAVKDNNLVNFRSNILNKNILIIDDLHLLSGQKGTLAEMGRISSFFADSDKIIITASSLSENDLSADIKNGIKNFDSCLATKLKTPDLKLKYDLANSIVKNDENSAKISVRARDLNDVKNIATKYLINQSENIHLFETDAKVNCDFDGLKIISEVERYFKLPHNALLKKSRIHNIALARYVAIYLLRKNTNMSMAQIAALFGFKSHANIVRAVKQIGETMDSGIDNKKNILNITTNIENLLK